MLWVFWVDYRSASENTSTEYHFKEFWELTSTAMQINEQTERLLDAWILLKKLTAVLFNLSTNLRPLDNVNDENWNKIGQFAEDRL